MSRRYGRRQRRAAREQIEALERTSLSTHEMFLHEAKRRKQVQDQQALLIDRIKEWDADIRSMLGPYTSFAIDDTTFRIDHPDRIRQMDVMPRLDFGPLDMAQVPEKFTYFVERVLNIVARLEEDDLITLSRYMRLQIRCGTDREGEAILGVSELYWKNLQRNPSARPRVIRDIAEQLLHKLAEPPKPKPRPLPSESWVDARR